MKKRIIPFLLILSTLGGCWDYTEIKDHTIISGISIDITEDGGYSVGFEILPMPSGESEPIEPYILSSIGMTIEEAVYNLTAKLSFLPYVSHAWLMLISEDVAKRGIADILDLIATHPDFYLAINIAVVKDVQAVETYACEKITSPILSHEISNGFSSDERFVSKTTPLFAYEMFQLMDEKSLSYTLPVITIAEEADGKIAQNGGVAVFTDNKLAGFLTADEAFMLNIALNSVPEAVIALDVDGTMLDFKVRELSAGYNASWNADGLPEFSLDVELSASTKAMPGRYQFSELELLAEDFFNDGLSTLIETSQKAGADFLRLSLELKRKHLARWREIEDDWYEILPDVNIDVNVNVTILD